MGKIIIPFICCFAEHANEKEGGYQSLRLGRPVGLSRLRGDAPETRLSNQHVHPYDNATAESFFKTVKVEEVYLWEYQTLADVQIWLPFFIQEVYNCKRLN